MKLDPIYNDLFKEREGFENFHKTYKGFYYGTVMGTDDRHEYLMLYDSRFKRGYRECVVPALALYWLYKTKPRRKEYLEVRFDCEEKDGILYVHMYWSFRNKEEEIKYKMYIHPKTVEQIKFIIIE